MLDQPHPVKNRKQVCTGMLLLGMLAAGCTSSKPTLTPDQSNSERTKEKKLLLSEYEGTLNPVEYDQEIEFARKTNGTNQQQQNILEIPKDSLIVQEDIVQGFRIQIFSSSSVDETSLMKNLALEKFSGDSIYVVYDAPVYKVRVGDFLNRYEASQRLPEFIEKGYRDAWIVPDRIVQRKLVRFPLSK
jgi:hypothetical protein